MSELGIFYIFNLSKCLDIESYSVDMVILIKSDIPIQTMMHWQCNYANYVISAPVSYLFPVGSRSMNRMQVNIPFNGNIPMRVYMAKYSGFKRSIPGVLFGFLIFGI